MHIHFQPYTMDLARSMGMSGSAMCKECCRRCGHQVILLASCLRCLAEAHQQACLDLLAADLATLLTLGSARSAA